MDALFITILVSICLGSLTLFLVWINWKILRISQEFLNVSKDLLKETIILRVETIKIREISVDILKESIKLRQNTEFPEKAPKKETLKIKR